MSTNLVENEAPNTNPEEVQFSRGRQPNRYGTQQLSTQVPLRFVHVPLSNRTPSVPDFASYRIQTQQQSPPHLSGEILRYAAVGTDPIQQFEERLRMAQLTVLQHRTMDFEFATRLRSRSTPSRSAALRNRSDEDMVNSALRLQQAIHGYEAPDRGTASNHQSASADLNTVNNLEVVEPRLPPPPTSSSIVNDQSHSSSATPFSNAETNNTQLHNRNLSSVSSSSPTHRIPSPPPLPPPSSERERLVQREREARSETERARRRHLALLRERQLEENHLAESREEGIDASIVDDRPTSVGSLEVVEHAEALTSNDVDNHTILCPGEEMLPPMMFCDAHMSQSSITHSAPTDHMMDDTRQSVASALNNNAVSGIIDHPTSNAISLASVGSTSHISGISEPPRLPPPATERERLVLREREARLETERARRRHIALLREQGRDHEDVETNETDPYAEALGVSMLVQETDSIGIHAAEGDHIRDSGTNNLSYTMERFLETLGEEEENALTAVGLTVDESAAENTDASSLPYTMELFLSENVPIVHDDGVDDIMENTYTLSNGDDVTNFIQQPSESDRLLNEMEHILSDHEGSVSTDDSVDVLNEYVIPNPAQHSGSNASDEISCNLSLPHLGSNGSLSHEDLPQQTLPVEDVDAVLVQQEERYLNAPVVDSGMSFHPPTSPLQPTERVDINFTPALQNDDVSPLHQSVDDLTQLSESAFTPHMPRLTEEGVAQLTEVDHASIGNAPPESVRDEPSESSFPSLVPFPHDHGFSVATLTTAMESVTETSVCESSVDVIRVSVSDSSDIISGNIRTSNMSVEAMPSIDSVVDSGSESHILSHPSSSELHSSPRSSLLESHVSSDEVSQVVSLTEEGVVAMEEIDHASIGNVPPRSLRDESISESSVLGRGSRSYGVFRNPSSSLGDIALTANASVEAMPSVDSVHSMSQDSVDAMPSEFHGNSVHEGSTETGNDNLLVRQSSDLASSTSLEALPSVHEEDNFTPIARNGSNETEDEDLVVYQSSDMASSTSIEALPSSDDMSSELNDVHSHSSELDHFNYRGTRLNGFTRGDSHQDMNMMNGTERTPLLPVKQSDCNGTIRVMHAQENNGLSVLTTVLVSFASGCFIGLFVGVYLWKL